MNALLRLRLSRAVLCLTMAAAVSAFGPDVRAAYLLEIDTDGADDGVLTYHGGFGFGGDTTTASQSISVSAYGTTGGDSLFGGDGTLYLDTYVYRYIPGLNADNLPILAGTDLGAGNLATGLVGGGLGTYRVYATWPYSENVSGGATQFTISTPGSADVASVIDQNYKGDVWYLLGEIEFTSPAGSIVVTQQPTGLNTFVSMRGYGVLFEAVPEPASVVLLGLGVLFLGRWRGR